MKESLGRVHIIKPNKSVQAPRTRGRPGRDSAPLGGGGQRSRGSAGSRVRVGAARVPVRSECPRVRLRLRGSPPGSETRPHAVPARRPARPGWGLGVAVSDGPPRVGPRGGLQWQTWRKKTGGMRGRNGPGARGNGREGRCGNVTRGPSAARRLCPRAPEVQDRAATD